MSVGQWPPNPALLSYVAWHMRVHAEKVSAPVRVMMMSEKCMQPMRPRPPLQGQLRSLYGLPGQSSCPISSTSSRTPANMHANIKFPARPI
jgi:hypothetical protein